MLILQSKDLHQVGQGANSKVFKVPVEMGVKIPSVVKTAYSEFSINHSIENLNAFKHCGLLTLVYIERCTLDGKPAILMDDINASDILYISPNTIRNNCPNNEAETFRLSHKLDEITNFESFLAQMRDVVYCTTQDGIELLIDNIFIGTYKGKNVSDLYYKIADVDGNIIDKNANRTELFENNKRECLWAMDFYIRNIILSSNAQDRLLQEVNDYKW